MLKIQWTLGLLALGVVMASAQAQTTDSCLELLRAMHAQLSPGGRIDLDWLEMLHPPIEWRKEKMTRARGDVYRIHRDGPSWNSNYRAHIFDAQGNPQWPIFLFGVTAASRLGFQARHLNDSTVMTVPSFDYLQNTLTAVSELLPPALAIQLKFHRDPFSQPHPPKNRLTSYLRHYEEQGSLPMADFESDAPSAIHDLAFHLPAIVLPNSILDRSRLVTRHIRQLTNHLVTHFANTPHAAGARYLRRSMRHSWVRAIDEGSARVLRAVINIVTNRNIEQKLQKPQFASERDQLLRLRKRGLLPNEALSALAEPVHYLVGHFDLYASDAASLPSAPVEVDHFRLEDAIWVVLRAATGPHFPTLMLATPLEEIRAMHDLTSTPEFSLFMHHYAAEIAGEPVPALPPLADLCKETREKLAAIVQALTALPAN